MEVICQAKDCLHNDDGGCLLHIGGHPVLIKDDGKCERYNPEPKKEEDNE